jgi:branched-chain amino acid transport system substrate-binding protein
MNRLVSRDGARIVIGPTWRGDGIATRDFAHHHPRVTVMATSFEQSATLKHPAANLFRFEPDAVQWYAGLGSYAYNTLGWRTAATVARNHASSWPLVQGFDSEFCSLGGQITPEHRVWVEDDTLGDHLPTGVDGVFLPGDGIGPFGGTDTFVPRWGRRHPPVGQHLIVGWAVLAPVPELLGVVGSSSDPYQPTVSWLRYLNDFAAAFPGLDDPGFANQAFFDEMEPLLQALARVGGDVSGRQVRLRTALAGLRYHSPEGLIRLDKRHQAIVPIYIAKVVREQGAITIRQIAVIHNVDQTFGGLFGPQTPAPNMTKRSCVAGDPPPWAR